jgi:1A family penicillin-binding protein
VRAGSGSAGRGATLRANKQRQKLTFRKKMWKTIGTAVGAGLIILLVLFAWYAKDLPNPTNLSTRRVAQSSKILDRNGKLLYEFGEQKRTVVETDKISNYLKQATVALEDKDFYKHHGLNFKGILRAAISNTFGLSQFTQGGSTITQQYIKTALLTSDRKISRKIKEAILAIEIESIYSKDEILAGYLNEIPYGNNAFGAESASRIYYGKSASDLTLSEAATLAAMPQRPSYFSPYGSHLDDLFARKDYALDQMAKVGFITQEEADKAKTEAPTLANPSFLARNASIKAPHFVFYVRDELIKILGDEQSAELVLGQEGYVVTTSLDLAVQEMAEKVVQETGPKYLERAKATNAAMVVIEPSSGDVLAMVGSIDYFNDQFGSVNVATSLRQPGSSFKPIVYATGLKGRFSPSSVLFDLKTDFGNYSPDNYDGSTHGPVTVRQALNMSLNIPAVKMLDLVGIDEALKTAKDLGITTLTNRDQYGLSLVLGAGEVKLVELTHAYSVFANQGTKMPLTPILKIVDKTNQEIVNNTDVSKRAGERVLDPQVAYLMADVMSDQAAKAPVFGKGLLVTGHQVASKTGTTQSWKDGWTVGYTPQIAVGVWAGNNDGTPMRQGSDAISVAAPIWRAFMQTYLADKPNVTFTAPTGVGQVTTDRLSGKLPNDGCATDNVTDWFASWNMPKDKDDVHKAVYIDKYSGKLATALTPPAAAEIRCYRTLHSERPDRSNWEAPVLAWAAANGYNSGEVPPTETDNVHISDKLPSATIVSPVNNQTVSVGNLTVTFEVSEPAYQITVTTLKLDDQIVATGNRDSRSFTITPSAGQHTLKLVVSDEVGNTIESPAVTVLVPGN